MPVAPSLCRYAIRSTDMGSEEVLLPSIWCYAFDMQCPVLTQAMPLPGLYCVDPARPGQSTVCLGATRYEQARYRGSRHGGTIPPIALRISYAMPGTDLGYAATRLSFST
eukprot:2284709-Rhodomonas_salina.7